MLYIHIYKLLSKHVFASVFKVAVWNV